MSSLRLWKIAALHLFKNTQFPARIALSLGSSAGYIRPGQI